MSEKLDRPQPGFLYVGRRRSVAPSDRASKLSQKITAGLVQMSSCPSGAEAHAGAPPLIAIEKTTKITMYVFMSSSLCVGSVSEALALERGHRAFASTFAARSMPGQEGFHSEPVPDRIRMDVVFGRDLQIPISHPGEVPEQIDHGEARCRGFSPNPVVNESKAIPGEIGHERPDDHHDLNAPL